MHILLKIEHNIPNNFVINNDSVDNLLQALPKEKPRVGILTVNKQICKCKTSFLSAIPDHQIVFSFLMFFENNTTSEELSSYVCLA